MKRSGIKDCSKSLPLPRSFAEGARPDYGPGYRANLLILSFGRPGALSATIFCKEQAKGFSLQSLTRKNIKNPRTSA
jgi:hypothetical protein